jgi:chromosome segregation ATPase
MSQADSLKWLDDYDQTNTDVHALMAEVREKESQNALNSKEKRILNRKLSELQNTASQLEHSLAAMEAAPTPYKILIGELNQRRGMMGKLKDNIKAVEDLLSGQRSQLLSGGKKREYTDTEATRDLSNSDLLIQQQQVLSRQDEHLDVILDGVSKLKVMSQDIGGELDLHQTLLDDLGNALDSTDTRLVQSTLKVQDIQEKEASCAPLCIIILLAVVIVALLIVPGN